jgi:hypothetical protein
VIVGELGDEIVALLIDAPQPMTVDTMRRCLVAARGTYVTNDEIAYACEELMRDGRIEAVHSLKLGKRYRIMRQAVEPQPAA